MAQADKVQAQVQLKNSADKLFKFFATHILQVPKASSNSVHSVETVHDGSNSSVKLWTYTVDGKVETCKEKIEIDEANMMMRCTIVGGQVLEQYKSCVSTFHIIPKGDSCVAKITVEYEKINADDPPPTKYLNFTADFVKTVDSNLVKGVA